MAKEKKRYNLRKDIFIKKGIEFSRPLGNCQNLFLGFKFPNGDIVSTDITFTDDDMEILHKHGLVELIEE